MLRRLPCVAIALASVTSLGKAQGVADLDTAIPYRLERIDVVPAKTATPRQPSPHGSLVLEALGGAIGSAAGIGLVLLISDCGVDDLACEIVSVGAAGAAGLLGATLGTTMAARQTGTRHSVAGAALGAILGTAVGLGVHYLVNRNSDRNLGDAVVVPIFAISQGLFAAIVGRR